MKDFSKLADKATIEETIKNLKQRNITAFIVENSEEAKNKITELLPKQAKVLASTSITLEETGIKALIDEGSDYISVRKEYMSLDHKKEADKIRILRSTPDIIVGSVHAVTKKGEVIIASNTGSQLAGYVAGAGKVIWVVGTQKVVDNLDEAMKRLNDYVVPQEEKHMQGLYGVGTNVSKLLIFNKEVNPSRVTLIFVNEKLGF